MGMSRLFAPVTPFFSEYVYQNMRKYHKDSKDTSLAEDAPFRAASVHYLMIPEVNENLVSVEVEESVKYLQRIVNTHRNIRDRSKIQLKMPVKEIVVVHNDEKILKSVKAVESVVMAECNARKLVLSSADREWATLSVKPNFRAIPKTMMQTVPKAIKSMSSEQIHELQKNGSVKLKLSDGTEFDANTSNVIFKRDFKGDKKVRV